MTEHRPRSRPIVGGGSPQDWLTPVRPDGSRHFDVPGDDRIVGCLNGRQAGLNILNPQPGYEYQWGSRDPREVLAARMRGWEVVGPDDPEKPAYRSGYIESDHDAPTPLDTADVYQDVVLLRMRGDRLATIREQLERDRIAQRHGAARAFVERASGNEIQYGYGRATRFVTRGHATTLRDGEEVVEQWTPDPDLPKDAA